MHHFTLSILTLTALFALSACGQSQPSQEASEQDDNAQTEARNESSPDEQEARSPDAESDPAGKDAAAQSLPALDPSLTQALPTAHDLRGIELPDGEAVARAIGPKLEAFATDATIGVTPSPIIRIDAEGRISVDGIEGEFTKKFARGIIETHLLEPYSGRAEKPVLRIVADKRARAEVLNIIVSSGPFGAAEDMPTKHFWLAMRRADGSVFWCPFSPESDQDRGFVRPMDAREEYEVMVWAHQHYGEPATSVTLNYFPSREQSSNDFLLLESQLAQYTVDNPSFKSDSYVRLSLGHEIMIGDGMLAIRVAFASRVPFKYPWVDLIVAPVPEEPKIDEVEFPKDEPPLPDPTEEPKIMEDGNPATEPTFDKTDLKEPLPRTRHESVAARIKRRKEDRDPDVAERIDAALLWLAHHQAKDGHWSAEHFREHSLRIRKMGEECAVTGNIDFAERVKSDQGEGDSVDVGLTALALLAFSSNGQTHNDPDDTYWREVMAALKWLTANQDADGFFGSRDSDESIYNHGLATFAICDCYHLTLDNRLQRAAQFAVDLIREAQNPGLGWRYGIQAGDNDTSVTSLMVLALAAAERAGLDFPREKIFAGANQWLDLIISKSDDGYLTAGYRAPGHSNPRLAVADHYKRNGTMDLAAICVRLLTGHSRPDRRREFPSLIQRSISNLPIWRDESEEDYPEHQIDSHYWFWGTRAFFELGGKNWTAWRDQLFDHTLLPHQRGYHASDIEAYGDSITQAGDGDDAGCWKLDEHGSWDPVGAWGSIGGRVHSTAMYTITLSIPHRYPRIADVLEAEKRAAEHEDDPDFPKDRPPVPDPTED